MVPLEPIFDALLAIGIESCMGNWPRLDRVEVLFLSQFANQHLVEGWEKILLVNTSKRNLKSGAATIHTIPFPSSNLL